MKKNEQPLARTECISQQWSLSSINRHRLVGDFLGGRLSSDSGALLLREVDKQISLTEALAACMTDDRHPSYVRHSIEQMFRQRIFAIALGYEDLNDHATLRDDPVMQVLAEQPQGRSLASPPTLCRLENGIDRKSLVKMAQVVVEQFIASFDSPPEQLILDFDATDDEVHGNQIARFFHGYYDHYCFLPLYVFCDRRSQAQWRYLETTGPTVSSSLAGRSEHLSRRQWFLPLAYAPMVRQA